MRFHRYILATVLICSFLPASADLLRPGVESARERLRANPDTYDRVDNFCSGKQPGASCTIPGTTFSGGGEGACKSIIGQYETLIDLTCIRNAEAVIDRKLPGRLPDGKFGESSLCKDMVRGVEADCESMGQIPYDQFCKGKNIGSRCTVELRYQDKIEHHEGICKEITEYEFYSRRYNTRSRRIVSCEPPPVAPHTYTPVSWWQKIIP